MKISFSGLDLIPGKIKYKDDRLIALADKFSSKKITPFFVELKEGDFAWADGIIILKDKILDLLILDIEKVEARLARISDEEEKKLFQKCLSLLEREIPLFEGEFSEKEISLLREFSPLSFKPVLLISDIKASLDFLLAGLFKKSKTVFFYTAGKNEVKAWPVKKDLDIVSCAGKIHSDLARGFIKADIINFEQFENVHNMSQARSQGLVQTVGREYKIKDGDIIEIRFNV
jgi:ribosome-binding ATPase